MDKTVRHILQILEEGSGSKGCLMVPLNIKDSLDIQKWVNENVPPNNIITQEHEIHITVLYGIKNTSPEKIIEFVSMIKEPIVFELKSINLFKQEDQDVLKIDVNSSQIIQLNKKLIEFLGEEGYEKSEYPFNSHLTLAYVKSKSCDIFEGHDKFNGSVYSINKLIYSEPNSVKKHEITINVNS